MSAHLKFARQLALDVGNMLLEQFNNPYLGVDLKSDRSVVTDADLAADRMITRALMDYYPDDMILSEELNHENRIDLTNPVWIVDPLDGTTNFSLGLHVWGVLLTRVVDGTPDLTVMHFPLVGELYTASRGGGAFLNDEPVQVGVLDAAYPLPFFACCSRTFRRYDVSVPYKIRILGSAAYTFCAVASGRAILGFEAAPKVWDVAGAWLLVHEAGGVIAPLDGAAPFPFQNGLDYVNLEFPTIAAPNPDIIQNAKDKIRLI